ncbi:MAG TPA: flagellar biosynthetic protein FliR [Bryobacteraceae bacterium]|nr:flagellar biosynthetic protein FliR [Bryobacteraceae bacterium]
MSSSVLISFLVVLSRVAGFFAFIPLPGGKPGPDAARVMLSLGFTMALYGQWPRLPVDPSAGWCVVAVASEAALGMSVGLVVACLTETFLMMAQVAGLQAGYGYASTIDPTTQADATVLLVVAQLITGMLFFAMGMDREILRVLARSLENHPPGWFMVSRASGESVVRLASGIFSGGVRLALPVVALLTLVDLALALIGRLNAQLQLVTLAFPAKMLVALSTLAAVAALYPRIYAAGMREALRVAAHLAGS